MIGLPLLWLLAACASAPMPGGVSFISPTVPEGASVGSPAGFTRMCAADSALCNELARAKPDAAHISTDFRSEAKLLAKVDRQVNAVVSPARFHGVRRDDQRWARPAVTRTGLTGGCVDVAIEKRLRLVRAGFPARDLYFAIVYRQDLGLHAVLVAHTERGDYVLDSRSPWVTPWKEAPYEWVVRQSAGDPMRWRLARDVQDGATGDPPSRRLAEARLAGLSASDLDSPLDTRLTPADIGADLPRGPPISVAIIGEPPANTAVARPSYGRQAVTRFAMQDDLY